MDYRVVGKTNVSASLLGYGCMRFPTTEDGEIDEVKAEKLLDYAYSKGINYFDTAYYYHSGKSEPFLGKVMSKYDRSSFYFADKLPHWPVKTLDDAKRIFAKQLERLQTDYIDFYLLHSLDKQAWERLASLGVPEYCESLKEQGKINTSVFHSTMITRYLKQYLQAGHGTSARFSSTTWTLSTRRA